MDYIQITKDNIEKEHICCAMSGKQSVMKKEWLKQRFAEGLVFYRSTERGKCFIEYIPAENAWVPIQADGYVYIDCLWVSGSLKGHGYANELLQQCVQDAKGQGRKGLCILSAEGRKREFLSDPKFMAYKGFAVADTSECGINLMYLPFEQDAEPPKFKACAKHPAVEQSGFVLYYTDQCPFTYYWVPRVEEAARAVSYTHLHNFRQYMGMSPAQYVLSLRMVNAQSLLEHTNYNVKEISEIVGYDNPLYFSRVFKKEIGQSPAQYRKLRGEPAEE